MILRVDSDSLASVMILDKRLEEYPEPYRGQKDMTLIVSFSQYTGFIHRYLEVTDYLATPSVYLKSKLALGETDKLLKAFYKDMACAIMKEVWFASRGGVATRIVHELADSPVYTIEYVNAVSEVYKREAGAAYMSLLESMEQCGYSYNAGVLHRQVDDVNYATLLYAMSSPTNEYGISFAKWSMTEE